MNKTQITAEAGIPLTIVTRAFDAPRDLVERGTHDSAERLAELLDTLQAG